MTDDCPDGRATLRDIFDVARDPTLSALELRLWLLVRSYEQPDGRGAFPGDEVLANHLGCSVRSVQRHRARLVRKGYLRRELRGPKPAYFWAVAPDEAPTDVADQSTDTGGDTSERTDTAGEATPKSTDTGGDASKASPKGSPKAPPAVSPEYGEYGEYKTPTGGEGEGVPSWPPPSDLPSENGTGHLQYPEDFERLWSAYPRQRGKKAAYRKVRSLVRDGTDPDQLVEAAEKYARRMEAEGRDTEHVQHAQTFFGPDDWWREELEAEPPEAAGNGPDYGRLR